MRDDRRSGPGDRLRDHAARCPGAGRHALRDGVVVYDGPSQALNSDMLRDLYGANCDELLGSVEDPVVEPIKRPAIAGPSETLVAANA